MTEATAIMYPRLKYTSTMLRHPKCCFGLLMGFYLIVLCLVTTTTTPRVDTGVQGFFADHPTRDHQRVVDTISSIATNPDYNPYSSGRGSGSGSGSGRNGVCPPGRSVATGKGSGANLCCPIIANCVNGRYAQDCECNSYWSPNDPGPKVNGVCPIGKTQASGDNGWGKDKCCLTIEGCAVGWYYTDCQCALFPRREEHTNTTSIVQYTPFRRDTPAPGQQQQTVAMWKFWIFYSYSGAGQNCTGFLHAYTHTLHRLIDCGWYRHLRSPKLRCTHAATD